jgi:hypothetical protein
VFTIAAAAPVEVAAFAVPSTDADTGSLKGVGEGAADNGVLAVETGELGSEGSSMVTSGSGSKLEPTVVVAVGTVGTVGAAVGVVGSGPGPPPTWGGPFMSTSSSDESSSASLSGRAGSSLSFPNVDWVAAAEPPS